MKRICVIFIFIFFINRLIFIFYHSSGERRSVCWSILANTQREIIFSNSDSSISLLIVFVFPLVQAFVFFDSFFLCVCSQVSKADSDAEDAEEEAKTSETPHVSFVTVALALGGNSTGAKRQRCNHLNTKLSLCACI